MFDNIMVMLLFIFYPIVIPLIVDYVFLPVLWGFLSIFLEDIVGYYLTKNVFFFVIHLGLLILCAIFMFIVANKDVLIVIVVLTTFATVSHRHVGYCSCCGGAK